jgi:hypothetical protein
MVTGQLLDGGMPFLCSPLHKYAGGIKCANPVWISSKFKRTPDGRPTAIGTWMSIVLSSILFGFGHLPITGDLIAMSPMVAVRAVLLSGVVGIIFGWLYQKYGLESAMISHFSCDLMLHVVVPLVASLFM